MGIENELKMLPRQVINRQELLDFLREKGYEIQGVPKLKVQDDTYYDNANRILLNSGSSLRIRRTDSGIIVTYKKPINASSQEDIVYKQREEDEIELDGRYEISIEEAVELLKQKYPDIEIPTNLAYVVNLRNNRNKVNIKTPNGTVIEIAFDDLHAHDKDGEYYKMKDELECEVQKGDAEELQELYRIISEKYSIQRNELSKYARAVKEVNEQRQNMSLDEIALCTMLSDIIRTNEFEQLKHKGQIVHDYRIDIPDNLELSNFKNPKYLIDKISRVKRTRDYKPGKIKNLEDMFLCFFSDMKYQDIEYELINFLNENYYRDGKPITNRMLHSQQVMLITGLISKSKEISEHERKPLLCMVSALVHDIGHVPGAHETERLLGNLDGFFSHEINGRDVIERIISRDEKQILDEIKAYMSEIGQTQYSDDRILEAIRNNKVQIKKSVEAHSRTNSEKRGDGTVVQLPREADKICYSISDIVDVIKKTSQTGKELPTTFFTQEWRDRTIERLGKGYERGEIIRGKIEEFERYIRTNNFGGLITAIANTVRENVNDGKTYYDVEQDSWDILNSMIDYVKVLRKENVINENTRALKQAAMLLIIRKFNESMEQNAGDPEKVWEETLSNITNCNDIDMLNMVKQLEMRFKNNPQELKTAFEKGGILDLTELEKLDAANRQIKILPHGRFDIGDMQPYFGNQYTTSFPERISDIYFSSENGMSICLREHENDGSKELIVKRKREKRSNAVRERKICNICSKNM